MIERAALTPPKEIRDTRGAVLPMLRADTAEFVGFGDCYVSEINLGKIEPWKHYRQKIHALAVRVGRISLVIFDNCAGAATRGEILNLTGCPHACAHPVQRLVWLPVHG